MSGIAEWQRLVYPPPSALLRTPMWLSYVVIGYRSLSWRGT